ncbi:MAG: glycosyltransferase family 4 protein, partial [Fusobacteriaceae bacterium]|nr:glycosyltransferase family 4 protein [Fusobacteriaceae bacterium]
PIIASRTGGIPEQIQNKRNGLLFRKGDSNDLAENIMKLIDNHSLAERLGKQAWTDCKKRYDPEIIARKTLDFYKKVID